MMIMQEGRVFKGRIDVKVVRLEVLTLIGVEVLKEIRFSDCRRQLQGREDHLSHVIASPIRVRPVVVQLRQRSSSRRRWDERAPAILVRGALLRLHVVVYDIRLRITGCVVPAIVLIEGMIPLK